MNVCTHPGGHKETCNSCYRNLGVENARLQERVKELEEILTEATDEVLDLVKECDRCKALAERFATSLHYKDVHELPFKDCPYRICQEARDVIAMTSEDLQ